MICWVTEEGSRRIATYCVGGWKLLFFGLMVTAIVFLMVYGWMKWFVRKEEMLDERYQAGYERGYRKGYEEGQIKVSEKWAAYFAAQYVEKKYSALKKEYQDALRALRERNQELADLKEQVGRWKKKASAFQGKFFEQITNVQLRVLLAGLANRVRKKPYEKWKIIQFLEKET